MRKGFAVPASGSRWTSMTPNIVPTSMPNRNVITIVGARGESKYVADNMVHAPIEARSLGVQRNERFI